LSKRELKKEVRAAAAEIGAFFFREEKNQELLRPTVIGLELLSPYLWLVIKNSAT